MPKRGAKKGGGGKQAGMTEEERVLYMQQRAQAEAELARRKEEMLTQFLKDKLQKEEKNSVVNRYKLTQQWRAILRQTRSTELRGDIATLSQTFERVLDRKDSIIKCLVRDLNEAEQQSAEVLRAHHQHIDHLLTVQNEILVSIEQQWRSDMEQLTYEFTSESEKISAQHQQECAYVEDKTSAMEQYYAEVENEAQDEYQSTSGDLKKRNSEEKLALQNQREETVKRLWQQCQQAEQSHKEATRDRHLVAYDSTKESEQQARKLQKIQQAITAARAELSSSQRESEQAVRSLRTSKDQVVQQVCQLKADLSRARAAERSKLTNLTMQSRAAAKKLQGIIAKGERILRQAELSHKLETERDKVLPFYTSSLTAEEQNKDQLKTMEPPCEELAKAMLDYSDLEKFWQRYNKTLLDKRCLEREKQVLAQENQQLQLLLRQYLDGLSVSDESLEHRNTLLMVSQPTLSAASTKDRPRRRHTVIEVATIAQANYKV